MTAKEEINKWKEEYLKLNSDTEKEAFKNKMYASLSNKKSEELAEGLIALKETARDIRLEAEGKIMKNKTGSIQVFPSSEKDKEMLEALLVRMNIPYKISA